jgi:predicted P-loop ATPase
MKLRGLVVTDLYERQYGLIECTEREKREPVLQYFDEVQEEWRDVPVVHEEMDHRCGMGLTYERLQRTKG